MSRYPHDVLSFLPRVSYDISDLATERQPRIRFK